MATAIRLDGLAGLRLIDPAVAALGATLADLLEAARVDVVLLHAPAAGPWFACADGVLIRIDGGAPLAEERVSDAAALLDKAEPILECLEGALGIAFEPDRIISSTGDRAALVAFRRDGLAGVLAVPLQHPAGPRWASEVRELRRPTGKTPLPIRILLDGPRLPIPDAGQLAAGDLVLLGQRSGARIEAGEAVPLAGQFDLASGSFTLHSQGPAMAADPPSPDFAVPLTLRLPDRMVSAARLAGLHPGAALPLGPITDGMPVELLVAGRPLARGELVQLGDRFAVLIEERIALDPGEAVEPIEAAAEAEA